MILFAGMLIPAAVDAGMKVPAQEDLDEENLEVLRDEFPHFYVFCQMQLARRMYPGESFANATIIAKIPEKKIRKVTFQDLAKLGCSLG